MYRCEQRGQTHSYYTCLSIIQTHHHQPRCVCVLNPKSADFQSAVICFCCYFCNRVYVCIVQSWSCVMTALRRPNKLNTHTFCVLSKHSICLYHWDYSRWWPVQGPKWIQGINCHHSSSFLGDAVRTHIYFWNSLWQYQTLCIFVVCLTAKWKRVEQINVNVQYVIDLIDNFEYMQSGTIWAYNCSFSNKYYDGDKCFLIPRRGQILYDLLL